MELKVGDKVRVKFWQACLKSVPGEDEATTEVLEVRCAMSEINDSDEVLVHWPAAGKDWWVSGDVTYTKSDRFPSFGKVICKNVKRFE